MLYAVISWIQPTSSIVFEEALDRVQQLCDLPWPLFVLVVILLCSWKAALVLLIVACTCIWI